MSDNRLQRVSKSEGEIFGSKNNHHLIREGIVISFFNNIWLQPITISEFTKVDFAGQVHTVKNLKLRHH